MAENSVSGNSMRPGMYTSSTGKKVEISHTDAEEVAFSRCDGVSKYL